VERSSPAHGVEPGRRGVDRSRQARAAVAARPVSAAASAGAKRRRLRAVVERLDRAYGRPPLEPRFPPVGELIYTVLSQNTADVNTDRTYAELRRRFATWSEVRDAPVAQVEQAIALGGLSHVKAPRIVAILRALSPAGGEPVLGALDALSDERALAYLQSLPGVGPKTAACVLLFALGRPAMPVDTHVHRVASRLGLLDQGVSAVAAHAVLTAMAGPEPADIYAAHVGLVRHGRRVCHARRPACDGCPLNDICPSAATFRKRAGKEGVVA
jgi:endonuclease-3